MKHRRDMLGDDGPSSPEHWDPIWRGNRETREQDVHIFISLNARLPALLEQAYQWLQEQVKLHQEGVVILSGHRRRWSILDYQDVKVVMENGKTNCERAFQLYRWNW